MQWRLKMDECICGHKTIDHAKFIGLACEKCTECTGWELKCYCEMRVLLASGCQCEASKKPN